MKRIVLTGASDGLGKAIGKYFSKNGYDVIALCRTKPDYKCIFIKTDLTDEKSVLSACNLINKSYQDFDVLINNAGVVSLQNSTALTYQELNKVFMINTISPMMLISNLLANMKRNKTDIINISSISGTLFDFEKDSLAYASSKWALRGMSYNLQNELSDSPCRVMNINPCGMRTKLLEKYNSELKGMSDEWVNVEEVAKIIYFITQTAKNIQFTDVVLSRK